MKIVDTAINVLDALYTIAARSTKHHLAAYTDLECTEDDQTLVYKDGTVLSIIKIEGIKKLVGPEEYVEIVENITRSLTSYMKGKDYAIQVAFSRDPDLTKRDISLTQAPARKTADKIEMDVHDIIGDRVDHLSYFTNSESCFLVLYTGPGVLGKADQSIAKDERKEASKNLMQLDGVQDVVPAARAVMASHKSFLTAFANDLETMGITIEILDVHDGLREIRREIDPEFTSDEWRPIVQGDGYLARHPDGSVKERDMGKYLGLPSLSRQLFPRDVDYVGAKTVTIGQRIYAPMYMDLGPQQVQAFSQLFSRIDKDTPWRISFLLECGGMSAMNFKKGLSSILFWASQNNKSLKASLNYLKELENNGEPIVKFRVSFATWADRNDPKSLISRSSSLARAFDGWGVCSSREEIGDPVTGLMCTIPALNLKNVGTACAPPLKEAVRMLPFMRPASPWKNGSVLFRTIDGKIWPYQPGSSLQSTWIDLIFAKPGSGKSVLMSAINLAVCLAPGATRLPRITTIDIGHSSSGLIYMLQDALPEDRKHEVGYHRLQMTREFAINVFDTQLGSRVPQPLERAFLKNFLTLLSTPVGSAKPYGSAAELAGEVVDAVYKEFSDENNPNKFSPLIDSAIDNAIKDYNIAIDKDTTWWEVTDALADVGEFRLATIAQRFASPLLSDCISIARQDPSISATYGKIELSETKESLIDAFCRMLSSSVKEYPVLASPTQFDVSDTKILALDLDEVAKSGGDAADRQTAVMYMLARYTSAKNYYLTDAILKTTDARYTRYHERRVKEISEDQKRICFDEFHRTSKSIAVRDQVAVDMREGRKWGVQVCLASQSVDDFDDIMVEFATNVYIMDGSNRGTVEKLTKRFGLSEAAVIALRNNVLGPGPGGAPFILISSTKKGTYTQLLYSTIGPKEMWSFSTTKRDVILRNELTREVGSASARTVLAKYYPNGSAENDLNARALEVHGDGVGFTDDDEGIITGLMKELVKRAKHDGVLEGV